MDSTLKACTSHPCDQLKSAASHKFIASRKSTSGKGYACWLSFMPKFTFCTYCHCFKPADTQSPTSLQKVPHGLYSAWSLHGSRVAPTWCKRGTKLNCKPVGGLPTRPWTVDPGPQTLGNHCRSCPELNIQLPNICKQYAETVFRLFERRAVQAPEAGVYETGGTERLSFFLEQWGIHWACIVPTQIGILVPGRCGRRCVSSAKCTRITNKTLSCWILIACHVSKPSTSQCFLSCFEHCQLGPLP